jgi:hypothetical protein
MTPAWWPFGGDEEDDPAKPKPKPKPPKVSDHTLPDIARGMQHAVNSTQLLVEQHYVRMLERYFDPKTGKAYTKRIPLPDGAHFLDVALIALIPPHGLKLDEMTVDMAVRIDQSVRKKAAPEEEETDITRTSFEVSFAPRASERGSSRSASEGSAIDIHMKFVAGDPPEGVARVMEYYTNMLVPRAIETGETQSAPEPEPDPTPPDDAENSA